MPLLPKLVGEPIKRREDPRLITGAGTYVDNLNLPGVLHAKFLRSPFAHARIKSINVENAHREPGVVLVMSAADLKDAKPLPTTPMPGMKAPRRPLLASDKVRHVGDPIAVVIATDAYAARDALDHVEVDYDPLTAIVDPEKAIEADAPKLYDERENNVVYANIFSHGEVEQAFASSQVVVRERLVNQRIAAVPMEPRGAVADFRRVTNELTLWTSTQIPHLLRTRVSEILDLPENAVRVIAPDVGGGFGAKGNIYLEDLVIAIASSKTGKPVKWIEERRENLVATTHGRDQIDYLEIAANRDGKIAGLKVKIIADLGSCLQAFTASIPTLTRAMIVGCYHIPNVQVEIVEVFTNKTPTDAYRGAGRPEATYIMERAMDLLARELNLDPADVRRKNFIPPDAFPYRTPTGMNYDSGDYSATLDRALDLAHYDELRREQERARKEGRIMGIGLSTYVEVCGIGPYESASVRADPSGKVTVYTGTSPHGQGIGTAFAQIVADELGLPIEQIIVVHGDTAMGPYGLGTYGSRSMAVGGTAVLNATIQMREKAKRIARSMLEAAFEDMVYENGQAHVRGAPSRAISFEEISAKAYSMSQLPADIEPGLEATFFFKQPLNTFPFGAHVAVVEIDRETGEIELKKYFAVDDCGKIINPMLVEGQVHGGLAQGISQALWEEIVYDEDGQLLTGTLMDYAIPKADLMPHWETAHTVTPTPVNPLGAKGVGEAGTIGSTPAVVNAVCDALAPFGVRHLDMPLKPEKIWRVLQESKENVRG